MIVHTQSPQRGPVPVDDAREGAGAFLTSGQGGPGAVPPDSMAAVIPFGQLDPNDSETLKQLALYLLGIGTVVIRTAQDQRVA